MECVAFPITADVLPSQHLGEHSLAAEMEPEMDLTRLLDLHLVRVNAGLSKVHRSGMCFGDRLVERDFSATSA